MNKNMSKINLKTNLKARVMRRVYIIYWRSFVYQNGNYIFALVVFCGLLYSVSMTNIWQNMPKEDIYKTSKFFAMAFINTEFFIKLLLASFILSLSTPAVRLGFKYVKKISLRPTFAFLQGQ